MKAMYQCYIPSCDGCIVAKPENVLACRKYMQKSQGDEALGQQLNSQMILEKSYFILYFQLLSKFGLFHTFKKLHFMQCDLKKKRNREQAVCDGVISPSCPQKGGCMLFSGS